MKSDVNRRITMMREEGKNGRILFSEVRPLLAMEEAPAEEGFLDNFHIGEEYLFHQGQGIWRNSLSIL